jgi:hypothetical protein
MGRTEGTTCSLGGIMFKNGKHFCDYCHISFGEKEDRMFYDGNQYHLHCDKLRLRHSRIIRFFQIVKGKRVIRIVPHRKKGGDPPGAA